MKRLNIILITIFAISYIYAGFFSIDNGVLSYYEKGRRNTILKMKSSLSYLGYAKIDDDTYFVAHNEACEGALCSLNIYLRDGKRFKLLEMLNSGESWFNYSAENDHIIFQWKKGIYIMKVHDVYGKPILNRTSNEFTLVLEGNNIYSPSWLDCFSFSYSEYVNGKLNVRSMNISPEVLYGIDE